MTCIPYRTADLAPGSLADRVRIRQLEAGRKALGLLTGIVIVGALLIGLGETFGILIANTDSAAPAGVYRVVSDDFHRGDLVAVCLPVAIAQEGLARGYLRTGSCPGNAEPVGKLAGALPGDIVAIAPDGVTVNDTRIPHSPVASYDTHGHPLAHVTFGKYRVSSDEVWLFGFNNRRSWDARYFGPIPLTNVRGKLEAVLTW